MKPEIIFFDCAGTLLHPAESIGEVYARTAAEFGISCEDADTVGKRFREAWRSVGRPAYPDGPDENVDLDWWRKIVRKSLRAEDAQSSTASGRRFEDCFQALFQHYARPDSWRMYADVLPALQVLRGNFRLRVLSNFDARIHSLLEGHGLSPFFETVVISSESGSCKPDPAIFQRAAALADVSPGRCLLAGDDPENDWQGAAAAGWQVFRLRRPDNSLTDLISTTGR